MSLSFARSPGVVFVAALALTAVAPALAQTVCITPNCVSGGTPAPCVDRAVPRTPTVLLGNGGMLAYEPANPRIEPGGCIVWRAVAVTHDSAGNACTDDPTCASLASEACQWDTANISSASPTPTSTCHYDAGLFPSTTAETFYCRIHASPTAGTMRGTLRVTTEIAILVDKELGTNSVKVSWTGGGVTGDVSYKVARQTGDDPTFGSTTTVNPDGGVLGTIFTDTGDLGNPTTRYYLVRNKQTNES